jgi:hypothetical protein
MNSDSGIVCVMLSFAKDESANQDIVQTAMGRARQVPTSPNVAVPSSGPVPSSSQVPSKPVLGVSQAWSMSVPGLFQAHPTPLSCPSRVCPSQGLILLQLQWRPRCVPRMAQVHAQVVSAWMCTCVFRMYYVYSPYQIKLVHRRHATHTPITYTPSPTSHRPSLVPPLQNCLGLLLAPMWNFLTIIIKSEHNP